MIYQCLQDLENDLASHAPNENQMEKITTIVSHIESIDTKITLPWIFSILKKNKSQPGWNNIYSHWLNLRKFIGRKDDNDAQILTPQAITFEDQPLVNLDQEIAATADALAMLPVNTHTLTETYLILIIILGLQKRFSNLDQYTLFNNFLIYSMTQVIYYKTGKKRAENFAPIHQAAIILINKFPVLRKSFSTQLATLINVPEMVEEKTPISSTPKCESVNLKNAIYRVSLLSSDIKQYEEKMVLAEKEYQLAAEKMAVLEGIQKKLNLSLKQGYVLPFQNEYTDHFTLSETDLAAWEDYALTQEAHLYHFSKKLWRKIRGNYQSCEDVMAPLYQYILKHGNFVTIISDGIHQLKNTILDLKKEKQELETRISYTKMKQNNRLLEKKSNSPTPFTLTMHSTYTSKNFNLFSHSYDWYRYLLPSGNMSMKIIIGAVLGLCVTVALNFFLRNAYTLYSLPFLIKTGVLIGTLLDGQLPFEGPHILDANLSNVAAKKTFIRA